MDFDLWRYVAIFLGGLLGGLLFSAYETWRGRRNWPRRIKTLAGEVIIFECGTSFLRTNDYAMHRLCDGYTRFADGYTNERERQPAAPAVN